MTELIVQGVMLLIAVGTFVGQTQHALKVFERRLDKHDKFAVQFLTRLSAIETHLQVTRR